MATSFSSLFLRLGCRAVSGSSDRGLAPPTASGRGLQRLPSATVLRDAARSTLRSASNARRQPSVAVAPGRSRRNRHHLVISRAIGEYSDSHDGVSGVQERLGALTRALSAFYRFTRPHTMLGTLISVCSVSLMALGPADLTSRAASALGQALVPALLMNVAIVGLNQVYDVDIDKVNKPDLPLASGEFSMATGVALVWACTLASLALGLLSGSAPLLCTLGGSLALGIAYSTDLPLLRWKQHPVVAAACILAVRAVLVQLGFYMHMSSALGRPLSLQLPTSWSLPSAAATSSSAAAAAGGGGALAAGAAVGGQLPAPLLFTVGFMLTFSIVIALFKDVPDVAGDQKGGVRTLSVRLGAPRVFWLCIWLLEAAYVGAVGASVLLSQSLWSRSLLVAAHAAAGVALYSRAHRVNLSSPRSIYGCYMFVWKLFYLEYLLVPLLGR